MGMTSLGGFYVLRSPNIVNMHVFFCYLMRVGCSLYTSTNLAAELTLYVGPEVDHCYAKNAKEVLLFMLVLRFRLIVIEFD